MTPDDSPPGEVLTPLEAGAMALLLAGDSPVLVALRLQLDGCRVADRKMTGVGFFTRFWISPSAPRAGNHTAQLTDVIANVDGVEHGIGFVLFVRDGWLDVLEGYTFGEPWPSTLGSFTLAYTKERPDPGTP